MNGVGKLTVGDRVIFRTRRTGRRGHLFVDGEITDLGVSILTGDPAIILDNGEAYDLDAIADVIILQHAQ